MSDAIFIRPSDILHLSTHVEGQLEVGGQFTIAGLPQGFDPAWFQVSPDININGTNILKISGPALNYSFLNGVRQIPVKQSFSMYSAFLDDGSGNMSLAMGIRDNFGRLTFLEGYRYPPEPNYHLNAYQIGSPVLTVQPLFNNEGFRIDSDGKRIYMYRHTAGAFQLVWSFPIPDDITFFTFCYGLMAPSNSFYAVYCRIDDSIIPIDASNTQQYLDPFLEYNRYIVRQVDKNHYGMYIIISPPVPTRWFVYVPDTDLVASVALEIQPLFIRPADRPCGSFVLAGETIQLTTNGGNGGLLEVNSGTVLPNFQWQAPFSPGLATFKYTIPPVFATCQLNIVNKLSVDGINEEGFAPDLAQGESTNYVSNCPNAVFSCADFPHIITPQGHLVAPTDAQNDVFGEMDLTIQVDGCFQTYSFKVHIQAMYPVPKFGGATPQKWKAPLVPDYLPNSQQMTGGTSQVKNRNVVGISVWDIQYQNLLYDTSDPNICDANESSLTLDPKLATAKRLDNFYKLVRKTKYFAVLDYQTGMLYKYVRLTDYQFDHASLFRTEQTRQLQMRQEGTTLFE